MATLPDCIREKIVEVVTARFLHAMGIERTGPAQRAFALGMLDIEKERVYDPAEKAGFYRADVSVIYINHEWRRLGICTLILDTLEQLCDRYGFRLRVSSIISPIVERMVKGRGYALSPITMTLYDYDRLPSTPD